MVLVLTQGEILRQWRERAEMTLEEVAHAVEMLAIPSGIDRKSKKIPRTHASLSRWETGKVEVKELGLQLLAEVYGVDKEDLRQPPPPKGIPVRRRIEIDADKEDMVRAFLAAMDRKA